MNETVPSSTRKVPLWLKIVLGVSLAVNLAVIGLAAGIATRFGDPERRPAMTNYAIPYVLALPREDRREIGDAIRKDVRAGRLPQRQSRHAHYRAMVALLETDPFDAGAAQVILTEQGQQTAAIQTAAQAAWLNKVAGYSFEERKAYAARLTERLTKRPDRKQKDR